MLAANQLKSVGSSRSEYAYQEIRQRVLSGRWRPGELISTYALAEELQISRTPISQALKRLASEGIIDIIPQVGCIVRIPQPNEIQETFLIRAVLEGLAAEVAASRITDKDISTLEDILKASEDAAKCNDAVNYAALNRAFHNAISQMADWYTLSRLLVSLWQLNGYQTAGISFFSERFSVSLSEHHLILEYLKKRDPNGARQATEAHLRRCAKDFASFAERLQKESSQ
jgi:DNA-binding GntR family transcriptional regulator